MSSSLSIANLGRAPHRLMFFVGGLNLLLAMAWWAAWLASARWGLFPIPQPDPYAGRLDDGCEMRGAIGECRSDLPVLPCPQLQRWVPVPCPEQDRRS